MHQWHCTLCRGRGSSTDGQAEKKAFGVHLRAPYRLRSADNLKYPFSNYVRGYTGLLDYIWYEPEQLEVQVSPTACICASHAIKHAYCAPDRRPPWHVTLQMHLKICGGLSWQVCALGSCCALCHLQITKFSGI